MNIPAATQAALPPPRPIAYPLGFTPPRIEAHLPPCNLTPIACSPGSGAAIFPLPVPSNCFPQVFVWVSLQRSFGLVFVFGRKVFRCHNY